MLNRNQRGIENVQCTAGSALPSAKKIVGLRGRCAQLLAVCKAAAVRRQGLFFTRLQASGRDFFLLEPQQVKRAGTLPGIGLQLIPLPLERIRFAVECRDLAAQEQGLFAAPVIKYIHMTVGREQ